MADTVAEYTKRVAKWTYDHTDRYIADPDAALTNGASAVLTLWRASFSGLRVSMTQEPDQAPRKPDDPPGIIVRGKLENTSGETPQGVEMGLAALGTKGCARRDPEFVKVANLPPGASYLRRLARRRYQSQRLQIAARGKGTFHQDAGPAGRLA